MKSILIAMLLISLTACSKAETTANQAPSNQTKSNQTKSNQTKSNQTKSNQTAPTNTPTPQGKTMQLTIGQHAFTVNLDDNPATQELRTLLPFTLEMDDLHQNEKYATLPKKLSQNDTAVKHIEAGDVLLWQGDTIVVFYESFATPYSYTRLGKISDVSQLKTAVGKGSVSVQFSVK